MKSLPSQQDAVAKVWTTDQSCGKSNFLIWNQIKIVNKWSQIKSKSCPSQIHIKSNPSFTTNQIFLSWFVNLNQIKIFLLAFLLMHWTKLEHKVKACFGNFERHQRSQNLFAFFQIKSAEFANQLSKACKSNLNSIF